MIRARQLTKSFDGGKSLALDGVTVDIAQGELVAVIGLSGAGKSTFLRSINATIAPTSGSLEVLGLEVHQLGTSQLRELRRQIGFIFQQFNLVKNLSVLKNVLVGRVAYSPLWRTLTGLYAKDDVDRAKRALDSVGLRDRYESQARDLSGGQQQRVAIARALVQEPKIILADEPMASLDPRLAEVVLDILSQINRERNITILVNIHVLELARKYARRILAFRHGKLVFDGAPAALDQATLDLVYQVDREIYS